MLQVFNADHEFTGLLDLYSGLKITSTLQTGDKEITFKVGDRNFDIDNEYYIRTATDEFVVKECPWALTGSPEIKGVLNLEDLEKKYFRSYMHTKTALTLREHADIILRGTENCELAGPVIDTGWLIGEINVRDETKKRTAGMVNCNGRDALLSLADAFMCEVKFDTINKTVSFYDEIGEDKGVLLAEGFNLKELKRASSSYNFATVIIPVGENDLSIKKAKVNIYGEADRENGTLYGKTYIENHDYSQKIVPVIWEDSGYTDPTDLYEDARRKLEDLAKPEVSYSCSVVDLAKLFPGKYSELEFGLGDTIVLPSKRSGQMEKQRIVKITEYPDTPMKNSLELSNKAITFEEMQNRVKKYLSVVEYAISSTGGVTTYTLSRIIEDLRSEGVIS